MAKRKPKPIPKPAAKAARAVLIVTRWCPVCAVCCVQCAVRAACRVLCTAVLCAEGQGGRTPSLHTGAVLHFVVFCSGCRQWSLLPLPTRHAVVDVWGGSGHISPAAPPGLSLVVYRPLPPPPPASTPGKRFWPRCIAPAASQDTRTPGHRAGYGVRVLSRPEAEV